MLRRYAEDINRTVDYFLSLPNLLLCLAVCEAHAFEIISKPMLDSECSA